VQNGPICSALAYGDYVEPEDFLLLEPSELKAHRAPNGEYIEHAVPLLQRQVQALENLQDFHNEHIKVHNEATLQDNYFLSHELWMKVSRSDLKRYAMAEKLRKKKLDQRTPIRNNDDETYETNSDRGDHEGKQIEYEDDKDFNMQGDGTDAYVMINGKPHRLIDGGANGGYSIDMPIPAPKTRTSFLKGIRRDVNAYKDFKEDRYYDSWIKTVRANAKLHGVSKVLDSEYIPVGDEEIAEFDDMQTYMWAIVVYTVKTATGKQLIREHNEDPQTIFAKLHQELKQSQKAEFSADDLHDTIKALAINKWTGSYVSFLEHWSTQLFLWCELVTGTREEPADIEKKKMLKTSVSTAAVMASIATQETIDIAKGQIK
jgi:hypothetical protein